MNNFCAWTLCTTSGEFVYLNMPVPPSPTSVYSPSYVRPVILLFNSKTTASNFKNFYGQTIRTSYCVQGKTNELSILRRPTMNREDVKMKVGLVDQDIYTEEFIKKLITAYAVFYVVEKYVVRRERVCLVGAVHDPAECMQSSFIHEAMVERLNDVFNL